MRTAILFGSTGLIGSNLLELLLNNNYYDKVKIFTRTSNKIKHPKLETYKIDFNHLENERDKITGDDCFFCIGTTRKQTPNKQNYIDIELNLPIKVANIAKENSIKSFIYISSGGASVKSKNLYLQNKGKAENHIINLGFNFTAIIQPSLLLGNRIEFRLGVKLAQFIFKNLSFVFISKLKPFKAIHAKTVAKAILKVLKKNKNDIYFTSDVLEDLGSN